MDKGLPVIPVRSCASCGFLGMHDPVRGKYDVLPEAQRKNPGDPNFHYEWQKMGRQPECSKQLCELGVEYGEKVKQGPQPPHNADVQQVFAKDRECAGWYPFRPGLTPQQHREEQRAEEVEAMRQAFELRLREMDERQSARQRKRDWILAIALAGLTVVSLAAQLFFPNGVCDLMGSGGR